MNVGLAGRSLDGLRRSLARIAAERAVDAPRPLRRRLGSGEAPCRWTLYDRAVTTDALTLRRAEARDVSAIARLVNLAFEAERFFVTGDRTSERDIAGKLETGVFFLAEVRDLLVGCVYVDRRAGGRGYIGMLAVDPARQRTGLGRRLMRIAEQHCVQAHCSEVLITVVNLRTDLMPFYHAQGYLETGVAPYSDTHRATQACHFIVMAKSLIRDAPQS
jgi:GNAT superfamily N-acetyltransferase